MRSPAARRGSRLFFLAFLPGYPDGTRGKPVLSILLFLSTGLLFPGFAGLHFGGQAFTLVGNAHRVAAARLAEHAFGFALPPQAFDFRQFLGTE